MTDPKPDDACLRGMVRFDRGEFFAAHEDFEDAWRAERHPGRRTGLQGLVHLTVAAHHLRDRDNPTGAHAQLEKALRRLPAWPAPPADLDLKTLLLRVREAVDAFSTGTPHAAILRLDWTTPLPRTQSPPSKAD